MVPFISAEVEYLIDNTTGILAKSYDIDDLAERIIQFLNNNELQIRIKSNIHYMINNVCSMNQMLNGFTDCFHFLQIKE